MPGKAPVSLDRATSSLDPRYDIGEDVPSREIRDRILSLEVEARSRRDAFRSGRGVFLLGFLGSASVMAFGASSDYRLKGLIESTWGLALLSTITWKYIQKSSSDKQFDTALEDYKKSVSTYLANGEEIVDRANNSTR